MRHSLLLRSSASLVALTALTSIAAAQTPTPPGENPTTGPLPQSEAPAQEQNTVDAIVVTAQRREQSLQDVPVVVTAISEETLEDAGVRDIKDLQVLVPGLTVTSTTSETSTTARIRGVGTVGDNPGLESSVGVTIDGVYRPRNGVGFNDLGELSRIEVLKGPQGTLFGRNTSAGVINIITEAPAFQFGAEAELTAGNYGNYRAAGSVTGPLTDRLAGRLFVAREVRDGFYDVRVGEGPRTETEDQNRNFYTVRGQLLFNVSDALNLRLIADYTDRDEDCCVAVQVRTGPTGAIIDALATDEGLLNPARPFDRVAFSNRGTEQLLQDGGVSLEGNLDLTLFGQEATLTSVTALRTFESVNGQDSDFTSADIYYRPADGSFNQRFDTFTQEVRLAGTVGRLDYLVGGFYVDEQLERNDRFLFGADSEAYLSTIIINNLAGIVRGAGAPLSATATANGPAFLSQATGRAFGTNYAAGEGLRDRYEQDTKSFAAFTHNILALTDRIDLTLGLRYTTEEKSVRSQFSNSDNAVGCASLIANPQRILGVLDARGFPVFTRNAAGRITGTTPFATPLAQTTTVLGCLPFNNPSFNNRTTNQDREEKELTGTTKISYRPNEDLLLYASYARGYKSGGFNLDRGISATGLSTGGTGLLAITDTSFPAEFVDSIEAGFKSTLLDGSLLFNATLFNQKFEDFQLNTFLGTTFVVESIPEVESFGIDVDTIYLAPLVDGLTLQGGFTYADTRYGVFRPEDLANPGRFNQLQLLPGQRLSFAPEFSGSASATYERPMGALTARFFLGAKYTSEYNTKSDLLPVGNQENFTLVNGRVGLGTANDRVRVELFGQNLLDEEYYQVVFNQTLQGAAFQTPAAGQVFAPYNPAADTQTYGAFLGQPRTFGVTLRLRY